MAVPCPECGREYDVTLFQFGHTVDCACGQTVTLEPRILRERGGAAPRFIADVMLGRLARRLRWIGSDTVYERYIADSELRSRGIAEGRIVLTRDNDLALRCGEAGCLLIDSEKADEQLRQVVDAFGLDWTGRVFTRCSRCNAALRPCPKEEATAHGSVPRRVLREQDRFVRCTDCGRIYWSGSHAARMRRLLERVLG